MKLTSREAKMVSISLIVIIGFVYFTYFFTPLLNQYTVLKISMQTDKEYLGFLQETKNKYSLIQNEIIDYRKELSYLELLLPSSKRIPEVIVQLGAMSQQAGVQLSEINFRSNQTDKKEDSVGQKEYEEISMQLKLNGGYDEIVSFLRSLERATRLYLIKGISVYGEGERLQVNLQVSTYAMQSEAPSKDRISYEFMEEVRSRTNPFNP